MFKGEQTKNRGKNLWAHFSMEPLPALILESPCEEKTLYACIPWIHLEIGLHTVSSTEGHETTWEDQSAINGIETFQELMLLVTHMSYSTCNRALASCNAIIYQSSI